MTADPAIEIRVAEPADGPALIRAIEQIDRETPYLGQPGEWLAWRDRPEATLRELAETGNGIYVIAAEPAAVVGYVGALAGPYRSTRGVLSIPHIGVRETQRRRGIALRLLATLEAWAVARDAHRVDLTVDEENEAARALYRKGGYIEEGCVREAVLDHGAWRSYIALAKLLGDHPSRPMAPIAQAPQSRRDGVAIRFRPVAQSDADAVRAWELALLAAPPRQLKASDEIGSPERFRDEVRAVLGNAGNYLVAALTDVAGAEQVVGLLAASIKPGERLRHDLSIIVNVLAEYRGFGVGRRLFAIGEDWARARGAHRLTTAVHAANTGGLRFAAAMGFAPEVVMRRYARFGDAHVDVVTLAKFPPRRDEGGA